MDLSPKSIRMNVINPLIAGGCAGVAVDTILFPLDTIKTRLQSEHGFIRAGGFNRIYAGLGSSLVGSAPNAAIFFLTYEGTKRTLSPHFSHDTHVHMIAASFGEIAACCVRVPVEVVKQRTQAGQASSWQNFQQALRSQGIRGLYRGYLTTVLREIPFSLIQFPVVGEPQVTMVD
ncbi:S-adenosylmethionine mitochondrial carrier protein [Halotydeus destructor]|nr:S-adenosylmethionine mitochondrial carrier protein [Halotydeus destructor]